MFRFILKILTIFFFLTLSSLSKNIDNIIVKGNERISSETILLFSDVPSDQSLDENSINKILKKLYESNFSV